MLVTLFRSRIKPKAHADYMDLAHRMGEIVKRLPGYISHKGFVAEDGERVTLVEFGSAEAQDVWRFHPEHLEAKKRGGETSTSNTESWCAR
jgi:heme-degrading monooxygenase HmoA